MITRLIGIAKSGIYRTYSTASFYELFPKNFPHGGPPQDSFIVNDKSLRREYRSLQSESHPDISSDTIKSSNINRAYTTLKNPYTRIAHFIHLKSPNHVNITDDAEMLMQVMEAHEQLELAESENELETLEAENNERIKTTEERINQSLKNTPIDWEELMMDAIRLKYWVNIQNGIKDWEPGKPVHLTH
ncbi:Fe-S protein assembly co-chaperone HscB [Candida albicans]|uniref:Fe-S protein assembly co-chaperone HscB n=1 Tax=Candida albicans TaxID=5476 RepID=A0A8H6BXG5_CANAX|nr:Fe-S protein assembly co-chaperone HscB [Candida albicans]